MARLDYNPFPTVATPDRPPNDYLNIPTRPAQFGADIGAAVKEMGAEVTKIGHFYGQVAADQATNNWEDETNKILRGDPNKVGPDGQPDTGFFGLRGQAAMEAWPAVRNQLMAARQNARNSLMTAESTTTFDAQTRRLHFMTLQEGGAHFTREQTAWAGEVNKASLQNALLGIAAHPDDDAAFNNYTGDAMNAMMKQLQVTGGTKNPELVNHTMALARQHAVEARVDAWAPTNPGRGKEFLEANKDALPGAIYDRLNAKVTGHADAIAIRGAVNEAMGSVGGGATPATASGGAQGGAPAGPSVPRAQVVSFWEGKGVPAHVAEGIADRVAAESGFRPTAYNPNDKGKPSVGLYQHRADRMEKLQAQPNWQGADTQNQFAYSEVTGGDPVATAHWNEIKAAPTRAAAAQLWDKYFERSAASQGGRQGFAQAAGASLDQMLGNVDKQVESGKLRPDLAESARAQVESHWRAHVIDAERIQTLQQKEQKEREEAREKQIIADATSDNPKITAQQIGSDPTLSPTSQMRMIGFLDKQNKPDPQSRISQQTTTHLLEDMRRPPGDSRRIDDMGPIYDAFTRGELSRADFSFLQTQMTDIRSPQGERLAATKKSFMDKYAPLITKSNPLMGGHDPIGDANLYMFERTVDRKIQQYKKDGKDPSDLFEPTDPNYLGSPEFIRPFQGTFQESLKAKTESISAPPVPPAYPGAAEAKPAITPRQPGESIPDYLKRTGAALPGMPSPPPAATAPIPAAPSPSPAASPAPSVPIR